MAEKISANDLKSRKGEFVIIDVREPDELEGGKIEGSTHLPLGLVIRKAKKGGIEELKDKKICTYCGSGYRGNIAADELGKAGFNAVTLDGGFPSWNQN
ncbi:MAG: rhodanese-like domain-containing protein [Nitrosopumilaceae archaeon]